MLFSKFNVKLKRILYSNSEEGTDTISSAKYSDVLECSRIRIPTFIRKTPLYQPLHTKLVPRLGWVGTYRTNKRLPEQPLLAAVRLTLLSHHPLNHPLVLVFEWSSESEHMQLDIILGCAAPSSLHGWCWGGRYCVNMNIDKFLCVLFPVVKSVIIERALGTRDPAPLPSFSFRLSSHHLSLVPSWIAPSLSLCPCRCRRHHSGSRGFVELGFGMVLVVVVRRHRLLHTYRRQPVRCGDAVTFPRALCKQYRIHMQGRWEALQLHTGFQLLCVCTGSLEWVYGCVCVWERVLGWRGNTGIVCICFLRRSHQEAALCMHVRLTFEKWELHIEKFCAPFNT